jgi:hypothetical protein
MNKLTILALACALFINPQAARAGKVIVGVMTNNGAGLPASFLDEEIKHLVENHVTTVRTGLASFNIDFIIKAYQHGIGSIVVVSPFRGRKSASMLFGHRLHPRCSPNGPSRCSISLRQEACA